MKNTMKTIIFLVLWFVSGVCSHIFWWTRDYDYRLSDINMTIMSGFAGPFAFIIGMSIHGGDIIIYDNPNSDI